MFKGDLKQILEFTYDEERSFNCTGGYQTVRDRQNGFIDYQTCLKVINMNRGLLTDFGGHLKVYECRQTGFRDNRVKKFVK